MARSRNPVYEAFQLAEQHGHFIVPVTEAGERAYVLYRKRTHPDARHVRIGRRKNGAALLDLVRTTTGANEPKKKEEAF